MDPHPLAGQVALVTGASRGLGRGFAAALADAGASVALMSRHLDECRAGEQALVASGAKAVSVEADVTDRPALEAALAQVTQALGPAAILVNNAVVAAHGAALE